MLNEAALVVALLSTDSVRLTASVRYCVGGVVRLAKLINGYLRGRKSLHGSSLNFVSSTNGKTALGPHVRGTESVLYVVDFAAHRLICLLVHWQVLI